MTNRYGGTFWDSLLDLAEIEGGSPPPPPRDKGGMTEDRPGGRWEPVLRYRPSVPPRLEGFGHPGSSRVAIYRTPTNGDAVIDRTADDRGWSVYYREGDGLRLWQIGTGTLAECVALGEAAVIDG